jgi:Uma2 family endonuclease
MAVAEGISSPLWTCPEKDERVVLYGVAWTTYLALSESLEQPGMRMSYLDGVLEIMTKSRVHEAGKKMLARCVELYSLDLDIPLYGYGEMTFRSELERAGIEPDECYAVRRDLGAVPDLAVEVIVAQGGLDKLPIYRAIGVPEVWLFDGELRVHRLGKKGYELAPGSVVFPDLDLSVLTLHVKMADQHRAVKAFRAAIKPRRGKSRRSRLRRQPRDLRKSRVDLVACDQS